MNKNQFLSPLTLLLVLSLAVVLFLSATVFQAVTNVRQELEEQARLDAEATKNFSFELMSYHRTGIWVTVEGNMINKNPDRHLRNVEMMLIGVADLEGNEIGSHVMGSAVRDTLRLPAQSKVPYSFTIISTVPDRELSERLQGGLQLSILASLRTGSCTGDSCSWCHPAASD